MSLFTTAPISPVSLTGMMPETDETDPNAIGATGDPNAIAGVGAPDDTTPSFGETLQNAFGQVNALQNQAADVTKAFALGQNSDIHSVMIANQQASLALQLTTQVRNKVVEAYQEIMRTSM